MLRSLAEPTGYRLLATDGEIGRCRDFLFDDERWTVRYMVADTGRWLPGRKILISPVFLERADWEQQRFPVRLTRRQIEMAPPLDSDAPISRRYEQTYHDFFKTPYYWAGNGLWGNYPFPEMAIPPEPPPVPETPPGPPEAIHLRSLREVIGYQVAATDGQAGRIVDFVVDDRSWTLRFAVLDTSRLPFSKKRLIATEWIDEASWVDQQIRIGVTAEQIKGAPEFDSRTPVNEAQETVLYDYYGRRRGLAADRQAGRQPEGQRRP